MPTKQQEATSVRCKAKTRAGGACAAPAMKGGEFCCLHAKPRASGTARAQGWLGQSAHLPERRQGSASATERLGCEEPLG